MKAIITSPLSVASFYVETFFEDKDEGINTKLSTATAFSYKYCDKKYLVTNYHVAYGRNAITNKPLDTNGGIPNKMLIYHYEPRRTNSSILQYELTYSNENNPFRYMMIDGKIADVAICELPTNFIGVCINEVENIFGEPSVEENIQLEITESLYVLGYPRGIHVLYTPVWKRSSIATEPNIDIDNMPCFYIDSTTREGMSGAPVVYYSKSGGYSTPELAFAIADRPIYKFVGIYSGRDQGGEDHIAQLGKVWRKELIERIILGSK